jgi:hypothetical protein
MTPAEIDEVALSPEIEPGPASQPTFKIHSLQANGTGVRIVDKATFDFDLSKKVHEVLEGVFWDAR